MCDADEGKKRQVGGITTGVVLRAAAGKALQVIGAVAFLARLALLRPMGHSPNAMGGSVLGIHSMGLVGTENEERSGQGVCIWRLVMGHRGE